MKFLKFILPFFLFTLNLIYAQNTGSYYNPKDDDFKLLGLKRAKELFDFSKAEFERQQQLFEKRMISSSEYERAKSAYADAEVNYQQALLAVLFEKQYVTVVEAVKYQAADGKKHVRLKVANNSSGGGEFKKLINVDDKLFQSLQPEVINNIYISLLNDNNSIISQPYEAKIEQLYFGNPVTIDFTLLQDLDEVIVNIIYGNGSTRAPKIFLQKDESVNKVVLQSEQFSQVQDLGQTAVYNMTLELFSGSVNTYKLQVANLPKQINRVFVDPATQARLSQFKFTETSQTKTAGLQVYLPDRPTDEVQINKPITFYVLAVPYDLINKINFSEDQIFTEDQIKKLNVGYLKLELIPRGIGELVVKAQQLFFTAQPGEEISVPIDVYNDGSRRLDNIEFELDLPLNWTKEITPRIVESLDIRQEKRVTLKFFPPENVSVGRYDLRLKSSSLSENQTVRAEDKTITVQINEETNIFGTIVIILLIIGIVGGIVVFGIKLTRK